MNVVLKNMHKVKGLEFDAVIITPSVTSLPFNPTEDIDVSLPLSRSDIEQIEEERRLLYVAYTRAKKFLFVYKGYRKLAVEKVQKFSSLEDQWGIRERKVGLDNYNRRIGQKFRADSIQGFSPLFFSLVCARKNLITLIRVYSILIILAPMAFKRPSMSS